MGDSSESAMVRLQSSDERTGGKLSRSPDTCRGGRKALPGAEYSSLGGLKSRQRR